MPKNKPRYAGFWIRFLALILDSIIFGVPSVLVLSLAVFLGLDSLFLLLQLVVIIIGICMDGIKGGTPGKLILKLRIVNDKNEFIGIPTAILRYIGKMLSGVIFGIGYLMIAWDSKKQGLHDKIAKTYVVYVR